MYKKILILTVLFVIIILIPSKSFSQEYNEPVLKSVISPYFSSVDSLKSNISTFKQIGIQDNSKVKKSKTKWYIKLGKGCIFGYTGAYLGWKFSEKLNIAEDYDEVGYGLIFVISVAAIGVLIGWFF